MKEKTFEIALKDLEVVVEKLESGDLSLEESLKKYEQGIKLVGACRDKLEKAREKIEKLKKTDSGRFSTGPFE